MEKTHWTTVDLEKLFQLKDKTGRKILAKAERDGAIPEADRAKRGSLTARHWRVEQLPQIGRQFGFLKPAKKFHTICIYTAKGGVLKTTLSYSLARLLAIHGIRVLIVGLDSQGSITEVALNPLAREAKTIDDLVEYEGLYDFASKIIGAKAKKIPNISDFIVETNLPTLDILPETPQLSLLGKLLHGENRREHFITDKIIPQVSKDYDVVIFDNGPNWNILTENALTASSHILSPVGCEPGSYQAMNTNLTSVLDFRSDMKLEWDNFLLIPTLREKNKLSTQIYSAYINSYTNNDEWPDVEVLPFAIRRAVGGAEAFTIGQSAIEQDPKSMIAQDYYDLIPELWSRINGD